MLPPPEKRFHLGEALKREANERKPFKCEFCGANLGYIFKAGKITRLRILYQIHRNNGPDVLITHLCHGGGEDVTCPSCQGINEFYPGREYIRGLSRGRD